MSSIFLKKIEMNRFIAICDASFCPIKKFAYTGYKVFYSTKPLLFSNICSINLSTSTKAEEFALYLMIKDLRYKNLLDQTILYCDHLKLVKQMQKNGLNISHIQGHKCAKNRDWIDWEFSLLDQELRRLLRISRKADSNFLDK